MQMSEGDLKRTVTDFLTVQQNMGRLMWIRLNAGDFIEVRGATRRRIMGAPKGCADLLVFLGEPSSAHVPDWWEPGNFGGIARAIFIELKSARGIHKPDQIAFQELAQRHGAEYHIVRNLEQFQEILR